MQLWLYSCKMIMFKCAFVSWCMLSLHIWLTFTVLRERSNLSSHLKILIQLLLWWVSVCFDSFILTSTHSTQEISNQQLLLCFLFCFVFFFTPRGPISWIWRICLTDAMATFPKGGPPCCHGKPSVDYSWHWRKCHQRLVQIQHPQQRSQASQQNM